MTAQNDLHALAHLSRSDFDDHDLRRTLLPESLDHLEEQEAECELDTTE